MGIFPSRPSPWRATAAFMARRGPETTTAAISVAGSAVGAPTIGCGIVFNLRPPTTACKTALCSWTETISWAFPGTNEGGGSGPSQGQLVFDQAGNLYGTNWDSYLNPGEVFQLVPSGGSWMVGKTYVTTDAPGSDSPFIPLNAVTLDSAGNLYSTSELGPENTPNCGWPSPLNGCGTVFQLTPTSTGWNANIIYTFTDGADGKFPIAGLVADQAGNLYGVSSTDGPGSGGTVFELSPSGGSWTYHQIYALPNGNSRERNRVLLRSIPVDAPDLGGPCLSTRRAISTVPATRMARITAAMSLS